MKYKNILTLIIVFLLIVLFIPAYADITTEGTDAINALQALHPELGAPATGYMATPKGCYRDFANGTIYFTSYTGAHFVSDTLFSVWQQTGRNNGSLGYPVADPRLTTGNSGVYSLFQNGAIYYHPDTGTRFISGPVYDLWMKKGGPDGEYGYPVTNTTESPDHIMSQDFQGGTIFMNAAGCDLVSEITRRGIVIHNQGARGTCSVFAIACLLEYNYTYLLGEDYAHLSVEYLNHAANVVSGRRDDGDFFENVIKGYNEYGVVKESSWPYSGSYSYSAANALFTDELKAEGRQLLTPTQQMTFESLRFEKENDLLNEAAFTTIRRYLHQGIPLAVGRSHSMGLVGYYFDSSWNGGGYYIFKNSYGTGSGVSGYYYESFNSFNSTVGGARYCKFPDLSVSPEPFYISELVGVGEDRQTTLRIQNNSTTEPVYIYVLSNNPSFIRVENYYQYAEAGQAINVDVFLDTAAYEIGDYPATLTIYYYYFPEGRWTTMTYNVDVKVRDMRPDLIVEKLIITNHTDTSITYKYTLQNTGYSPAPLDGPTAANWDNVSIQAFLSVDQEYNAGDIPAGGRIIGISPLGNLDPGETFTGTFTASVSAVDPAATPYLICLADWSNRVDEADETNNSRSTRLPAITPGPTLAPTPAPTPFP